jgi:hypothetical protein
LRGWGDWWERDSRKMEREVRAAGNFQNFHQ